MPIWPDRYSKENIGKVKITFLDKMLTCWLKEGAKAVSFLKIRLHGSSMAKNYGHLKMLAQMRSWRLYSNRPDMEITFAVMARASRPTKQREEKPTTNLAFSWHTSKLSSLFFLIRASYGTFFCLVEVGFAWNEPTLYRVDSFQTRTALTNRNSRVSQN